ncbi:MAG: metallophosphoesterase family protein [Coriobacteriia bacterium]|nr:metallophosphoesterase family protein [Coriobacteriia bacterium]
MRAGLISDTHGYLDPRVLQVFRAENVAAIIHAGDIGRADVLWELSTIAPVTAVLGNCDRAIPGWLLEGVARMRLAGVRVLAIHNLADLGSAPVDVDVVVYGHSHIPVVGRRDHVLAVNPGSATQRRRMPSTSVGILEVGDDGQVSARIVELGMP